jgi:predicted TIM-barrel fold metal-dependent hydrolase
MPTTEPRHHPHPPVRPDWLAQRAEPALEPELPIVDAHHHLWEMHGTRYRLDEFLADTRSGHDIRASVFVQCGWAYRETGPEALRPLGETEAVVTIAEEAERRGVATRVAAGIVGFADLALGAAVEPILRAQIEAGRGRFRGVRHVTARHEEFIASIAARPPAGLMGTPAFRDGAARLAALGMRFDAWLYHHQLDELADLASAMPHLPVAVNHVGGPIGIGPYEGRRDESFAEWRAAILRLAMHPNVVMKLGGLGMRVSGFTFHEDPAPPSSATLAEAWRPYIETCIEAFGATRCMFESNFPVDKGMFAYGTCWNAFKRLASGASAEEKAMLFAGTATRFYAL